MMCGGMNSIAYTIYPLIRYTSTVYLPKIFTNRLYSMKTHIYRQRSACTHTHKTVRRFFTKHIRTHASIFFFLQQRSIQAKPKRTVYVYTSVFDLTQFYLRNPNFCQRSRSYCCYTICMCMRYKKNKIQWLRNVDDQPKIHIYCDILFCCFFFHSKTKSKRKRRKNNNNNKEKEQNKMETSNRKSKTKLNNL